MRKAMQSHFGEQPVAMGGAFHIVSGKAKLHVMVTEYIPTGIVSGLLHERAVGAA